LFSSENPSDDTSIKQENRPGPWPGLVSVCVGHHNPGKSMKSLLRRLRRTIKILFPNRPFSPSDEAVYVLLHGRSIIDEPKEVQENLAKSRWFRKSMLEFAENWGFIEGPDDNEFLKESLRINEETTFGVRPINLLRLKGIIFGCHIAEIYQILDNLIENDRTRIVVDLSGISGISLDVWLALLNRVMAVRNVQGDVKLAALQPAVRSDFERREFDQIISHFPTVTDAIKQFQVDDEEEIPRDY